MLRLRTRRGRKVGCKDSNEIHKVSIPKPNSRSQIKSNGILDVLKSGCHQMQSPRHLLGVGRGAVTISYSPSVL